MKAVLARVGIGHRAGLAGVEDAVVVGVDVDDHAGKARLAAVLDAVAVEVVEDDTRDGSRRRVQERVVEHRRASGVVDVVRDLGRDLRGVRRAPVVVGQVDRGGGVARGDDTVVADVGEVVPGNVDGRAAVDGERARDGVRIKRVVRTGAQGQLVPGNSGIIGGVAIIASYFLEKGGSLYRVLAGNNSHSSKDHT